MFDKCPGSAHITTPTIEIKECPNCGFIIYNDINSCIQWCKHAKECVGEELYKKLMKLK